MTAYLGMHAVVCVAFMMCSPRRYCIENNPKRLDCDMQRAAMVPAQCTSVASHAVFTAYSSRLREASVMNKKQTVVKLGLC
jgi:hypothetical protein